MDEMTDKEKQAVDAVDSLCHMMNTISGETEIFKAGYDSLLSQHRTIQQTFWRWVLYLISQYGEAPCDGRNADAVLLCMQLKGFIDHNKLGYLPFI
jgi:hypothetical protein